MQAVEELLACLGIVVAVALVFAVLVASGSVASSAGEVVHAVVGPANLQLRARDSDGLDERLLTRVEHVAGIKQAAPLLEQTATLTGPHNRSSTVDVAGTDVSLALLNGLAHTLPIAALSPGGIGLSRASAGALGLSASTAETSRAQTVLLKLRGSTHRLKVFSVLGPETFGALARAPVAVMPLKRLQQLAGLQRRISRILIQTKPGQETVVRGQLLSLARGRFAVTSTNQDVNMLHQALGPSDQASELFAAISALLGFLLAFNAMLLTVPERRQTIADMRVDGTRRTAIIQMVFFQALCLAAVASFIGLVAGYALSTTLFHETPGYLARAFTLSSDTVIGTQPLALALLAGILAASLASVVPLLDLRRGRALDVVYLEDGIAGNALGKGTQRWLGVTAAGLLFLATTLFILVPQAALFVCMIVALATVLVVPLMLTGALHTAGWIAERYQRFTLLPIALTSLRATTIRSLALAATGALALFGCVALGGSRDDLLRGIDGYTSHYVAGADIWLVNPNDNQAVSNFSASHLTSLRDLSGVASVHIFEGSFDDVGNRRLWIIAWPSNIHLGLLDNQIIAGNSTIAAARVGTGHWITASAQLAAEHHVRVGDELTVPTPTGNVSFRIAATTTNFGWSPGAIIMNTTNYSRAWATLTPSALGVNLLPGTSSRLAVDEIKKALGPNSGLEVLTSHTRETRIDASASEGLNQLGEISNLLIAAAVLAMIAALGSGIWQRRVSLAGLRSEGTKPSRLRRVLLIEIILMLCAGGLTGAIAGVYGQVVIDGYLKQVTGFPVASFAVAGRPFEIFVTVVASVLIVAAIPGWFASRVTPTLAFDE